MSESVYKIIELVGSCPEGWEKATQNAIDQATKSLRNLRIVEVVKLDAKIDEGKIVLYRARVKLSFKFED